MLDSELFPVFLLYSVGRGLLQNGTHVDALGHVASTTSVCMWFVRHDTYTIS